MKRKGKTARSETQGFTLIELLVVVSIIALLAAVVLAALSSARAKARDTQRINAMHQIVVAMNMFSDANGGLPQATSSYSNPTSTSPYCGSNGSTGVPSTCWNYLKSQLSPYITQLPIDPINIYPSAYYYRPLGYPGGCTTQSGAIPPVLIFSTEVNSYPLMNSWTTLVNGSNVTFYCMFIN